MRPQTHGAVSTQLANIRWVKVDICLAVLLSQCCQITLARYLFAYRADVIVNVLTVASLLVQRLKPKKPCICQRNANHSLSINAFGQLWSDMI